MENLDVNTHQSEPRQSVDNQRILNFPVRGDSRGELVAIEGGRDIDFDIARTYYIFGTQPGVVRGLHAHRRLRQVAVCISGSCLMMLDDGHQRRTVQLNRPNMAIEIGAMIWHEMSEFSIDAILMVLADDRYDESDYIRDYAEFLRAITP